MSFLVKKSLSGLIVALTLFQGFMPVEVVYGQENNPDKFILSLENNFGGKLSLRQANLIFRTLYLFPEGFFRSLKEITFHLQHKADSRGKANDQEIILNASHVSDPEMIAVLIHELGHVYDLGTAQGSEKSKNSPFRMLDGSWTKVDDPSSDFYKISWKNVSTRLNDQKDGDFVSGYAKSIAMEDFGETFAFFVLHKDEFEKRAQKEEILKKKYEHLLNKVFKGEAFSFGLKRAYPLEFYDTTKLPYDFPKMLITADTFRKVLEADIRTNRKRNTKSRTSVSRLPKVRLREVV